MVRKLVKNAVVDYESTLIKKCKSNPKLLYSYIKGQTTCKDYIKSLSRNDGSLTTNGSEIAHLLSSQFCSVFNLSYEFISSIPEQRDISFPFVDNLESFTTNRVLKEIKKREIF